MKSRIGKWGNSLAVRIPKSLADEVGLDEDSVVDLVVEQGMFVVKPAKRPKYRLEDLLKQITKDNTHDAVDWGSPRGREIW